MRKFVEEFIKSFDGTLRSGDFILYRNEICKVSTAYARYYKIIMKGSYHEIVVVPSEIRKLSYLGILYQGFLKIFN